MPKIRSASLSAAAVSTRADAAEQPEQPIEAVRAGLTVAAVNEAKAPRQRRPSRKGLNQKEKILVAAFECFSALGFDAASTRLIAQKAKISHTAVLYHFQTKDQLWIATMETAIADYMNSIRATIEDHETLSAKEALQTFIREFVRFSARSPGVHRMLSMESAQGTDRLHWIIDHYLRHHFNVIRNLIRRGQAEQSVREGDPAQLYYFILSAGAAPFTLSTEYKALTGRDVFSETAIYQTIGFIYDMVFLSQ